MRTLAALGLNATQSLSLLTHRSIALAQSDAGAAGAALDALFDASDRPEGGAVVLWCNDLAQDARYAYYSSPSYVYLVLTVVLCRYARWGAKLHEPVGRRTSVLL